MQENMQQIQNSENNPLPSRNIIIVRLSYCVDIFGNDTARKDKKAIRVFLNNVDLIPELDECIIIVDKSGDVDFDCRSNNVLSGVCIPRYIPQFIDVQNTKNIIMDIPRRGVSTR